MFQLLSFLGLLVIIAFAVYALAPDGPALTMQERATDCARVFMRVVIRALGRFNRRSFRLAFAAGIMLVALQAQAALHLSTATRNALATAIITAIDAGTAGVIEIRTGANPAGGCTASPNGTLLATLTMSATSGTASGGELLYNAISDDASADTDGTAAHFEVLTQTGGTCIYTGSVAAGSGDISLTTVSIVTGARVRITPASTPKITMPGA